MRPTELMPKVMRDRICLDYPLDVLLSRDCRLTTYELGVVSVLRKLAAAADDLLQNSRAEAEAHWGDLKLLPGILDSDCRTKEAAEQALARLTTRKPQPWSKLIDAYREFCPLKPRIRGRIGSLVIPTEERPGTGNLLIRGRPGTGKSTLGLQIAMACTCFPNFYSSLFVPLEQSAAHVLDKCATMGCREQAYVLDWTFDSTKTDGDVGHDLKDALRSAGAPKLIIPQANPGVAQPRTFQHRFEQLETLLRGFRWLRENDESIPELRAVCIDGLGALGESDSGDQDPDEDPDAPAEASSRGLSRHQLLSLFDLCRSHGCIGVFTAEHRGASAQDALSYLSDMVIELRTEEDSGYTLRHLQITKSRHQHQVYGAHPFKIRSPDSDDSGGRARSDPFQAVIAYPSVHYVVASTGVGSRHEQKLQATGTQFDIGDTTLNSVMRHDLRRASVVTVQGPRGTYKSHIARNFVLAGLIKNRKSALCIYLGERALFDPEIGGWLVSESLISEPVNWAQFKPYRESSWINDSKMNRRIWRHETEPDAGPCLIELDLKQGALLPEEFIETVRDVQREYHPSRWILDDVSLVGTSYPLLRKSHTAGDMVLSALVHIAKCSRVDLVMVGTLGEFKEADAVVKRICTLSDTVLSCAFCDVFGDRLVTVTGEGLMVASGRRSSGTVGFGEYAPAVIGLLAQRPDTFGVDLHRLEGLVGFERGQIQRPGVVLNLFSEGRILTEYNRELRTMLECAFAVSGVDATQSMVSLPESARTHRGEAKVAVFEFGSDRSEAVHDSLRVLGGRPIDKTVLYTVDEFYTEGVRDWGQLNGALKMLPEHWKWQGDRWDGFRVVSSRSTIPYYSNFLLVAYNAESNRLENVVKAIKGVSRLSSWRELLRAYDPECWSEETHGRSPDNGGRLRWFFDCDTWSRETLACILMDTLARGNGGEYCELVRLVDVCSSGSEQDVAEELKALARLFRSSFRYQMCRDPGVPEAWKQQYAQKLVPNAAVYVCWYSQLRELIDDHPALASKLRILELPGGGVRGDWFLGIGDGSVSSNLGLNIIKILCGENEEYKRFCKGVGLPTRTKYETSGLLAWPKTDIELSSVLTMHDHARSRSRFAGYGQSRRAIGAYAEQLAFLSKADEAGFVESLLQRLPATVKTLGT